MFASILDVKLSEDDAKRWATVASLSVALLLVLSKAVAYVLTDSLSLMSSLVDSGSDVVASFVTYIGIRASLKPADYEHRFGHGKAEAMAALGTAVFVCSSAGFLLFEAVARLFYPHANLENAIGIAVMLFSMLMTFLLISFQGYVVKRTGSVAISADEKHYTADFASNAAVLVSLLLVRLTGITVFDTIVGVAVAGWLVWQIFPVARRAIDMLMDRELPEDQRARVLEIARSHKLVRGVHDMRTRMSGDCVFVELHMEFDGDLPLRSVHAVGSQIEVALHDVFPDVDVLIHFDPVGVEERRQDDVINS